MNIYIDSYRDIKENYSLKSLKYTSDRIIRAIKELEQLQVKVVEHSQYLLTLDSKFVISVRRLTYKKPIEYRIEVHELFTDNKDVYTEGKTFGASREDKAAVKEYIKMLENKYNVICECDYKKLKL